MRDAHPPFQDPAVEQAFAAFPEAASAGLLELRHLIFDTAARTPEVGPVQETLKWGQPAYLTPETKAGSTLRLGCPKGGGFAIYAHCQTTIISDFKSIFPDTYDIEGNRAVRFTNGAQIESAPLCQLIRSALTYHLKPSPRRA